MQNLLNLKHLYIGGKLEPTTQMIITHMKI